MRIGWAPRSRTRGASSRAGRGPETRSSRSAPATSTAPRRCCWGRSREGRGRRRAARASRRSAPAGRRAPSPGRSRRQRSRSSYAGRSQRSSRSRSSGSARTSSSRTTGVDALVLKLEGELAAVEVDGERVRAGGGAANAVALHRARDAGLGGFEFACAIPGTIGGGVWMNAGAYGSDFAAVLERALVATADGSGWLTPGRARAALPALGAPARPGRPRRPSCGCAAATAGRDQGRGPRAERAPQGGAADEQAHLRQRLQEPGARADRGADARGVRPAGPPDRRRADLPEARELHRERRTAPRPPTRSR